MASSPSEGTDLTARRCLPCEGGVAKLSPAEIAERLPLVPGWSLHGAELRRCISFPDFLSLMRFVNRAAELAESEGHHPDFSVHYDQLDLRVWTHALGGLSENDFILAAKLSALPR